MRIRVQEGIPGNGTLRYAWGSYNPKDISGTISPQYLPLTGSTEVSAEAQLTVSATTEPGNYTLALGIETPSLNVWTMISVKVLRANPSSTVPYLKLAALGGVAVLA